VDWWNAGPDVAVKKYPKIRRLGHPDTDGLFSDGEVVVHEKMDGANFRIHVDSDAREITFGSRNLDYSTVPNEDVPKNFRPTIEWVSREIDAHTLYNLADNLGDMTLFGESMHSHTLDYPWEEMPRFLGFDVFIEDGPNDMSGWLRHGEAMDVFQAGNLPVAPVLDVDDAENINPSDYEEIESQFRDGIAEGVVMKNASCDTRAKLITEAFAEKHESAKAGTDNGGPSDESRLADKYTGSNRRIEKTIEKMVNDEGRKLEMPLMEDLPQRVLRDIGEEEGASLLLDEDAVLDLHQFRKQINRRCANELRDKIRRRGMEQGGKQAGA
jgi:hypothetical protein